MAAPACLGIATAKFIGWVLTGSASMLAEGFHSVADSGNQLMVYLEPDLPVAPAPASDA